MSKETISLKANRIFLLTAVSLLAGSSLARPVLAAAKAETVEAKTGWAISRVASMTQGSYCTMAQKFGNNSVVTIGQNINGEYSLAFDFQEAKFKAGKKLTASVRVGSGSAQTFEIEPQTSQTLVLGVGADAGFAKSLKASPLLQLDVSGDSFSYKLARIEDGQSELATCLSGLKSPAPAAPSSDGSKGKVTGSKADKLEQARVTEPKAEDILQAEPSSGGNVGDDILQAQEENLRLKATLGNAKEEKKSLGRDNPALGDLQEKLRALELENSDLRKKVEAQDKAPKVVDLTADLKKAEVDLEAAKKQNADLQAQVSTLEKEAQGQKETAEKLAEVQKDLQKSERDMTTFKAENETLRNQVKIGAKAGESGAAESLKLADLQAENAKLLAEIDALKNRSQPDLAEAGKDIPQEIKELKEKIAVLQIENTDLKARDVQAASVQPAAGTDDDSEQRAQLRALKSQIDTLTSENGTLKNTLEKVQKESEKSQLKAAGGNWDLEQATRRFQESQREIRRLGALLEGQKAKCVQEKKDIEYMLFDPELAKSAQISMLGTLEDQLIAKDLEISRLKEKVGNGGISPEQQAQLNSLKEDSAQKEAQISELKAQLAQSSTQMAQLQSAKETLSQKEAKLAELEKKLSEIEGETTKLSAKSQADLSATKAQLDEKAKKVAELEAQLVAVRNETSAKLDSVAQKDAEYALLKKELEDAQSQVKVLNSKSQTEGLAIKAQLDEKTKKVAELEAQLVAVRNETSAKLDSVAQKDAEYALLKKQLEEAQAQLSSFNTKAQSDQMYVKTQLDEKTKKVAELEAQLAAVKTETSAKLGSVAQKDADYALLQKQLQEAQAQLSSFNTKAQSDQMYAKTQLDEKTKKVAELEAQLLSAQTEFSAKLDVATRQSQVQGQQINDLQKQLDQAKSAQSTVEAKAKVDQSASLVALQSQLSQGNQRIGELENQIRMLRSEAASAKVAQVEPAAGPAAISAAPLAPTSVVSPVSYSPRASSSTSSSPSGFKSSDDFSSLLKSAGVTVQGGVHAAAASSTSYRAYSWKTDSLYGSAEQRAMSSSGYEAAVDQYLSRAKSRCGGEYAAIPAQVSTGAAQSKAFEIACVNSKGGTSASVLFTYSDGVMTTIAHEGRAEAMDIAMEARDRVAGQVR